MYPIPQVQIPNPPPPTQFQRNPLIEALLARVIQGQVPANPLGGASNLGLGGGGGGQMPFNPAQILQVRAGAMDDQKRTAIEAMLQRARAQNELAQAGKYIAQATTEKETRQHVIQKLIEGVRAERALATDRNASARLSGEQAITEISRRPLDNARVVQDTVTSKSAEAENEATRRKTDQERTQGALMFGPEYRKALADAETAKGDSSIKGIDVDLKRRGLPGERAEIDVKNKFGSAALEADLRGKMGRGRVDFERGERAPEIVEREITGNADDPDEEAISTANKEIELLLRELSSLDPYENAERIVEIQDRISGFNSAKAPAVGRALGQSGGEPGGSQISSKDIAGEAAKRARMKLGADASPEDVQAEAERLFQVGVKNARRQGRLME